MLNYLNTTIFLKKCSVNIFLQKIILLKLLIYVIISSLEGSETEILLSCEKTTEVSKLLEYTSKNIKCLILHIYL